jgi:serine/threonine-protein kinase HipA
MERTVLVYIDLDGIPHLAGRLWTRARKGHQSATFEYDRTWLEFPQRFALEPALSLFPGPHHTPLDRAMFGAVGDSAPDRWGRVLMLRAERRQAKKEGRSPRTLLEADYLLRVDDETRQGALRFAEREGGPFLAALGPSRVPPLVELPRLLHASEHVATKTDTDEDLRLLLAPGSSLGGARPKASVRDRDGCLAIAKFPHKGDEFDTERWEAVALALAGKAGIAVPDWRREEVGGRSVLLLRRFDREGECRVPFLSAMSMLGAKDNQTRSYLEIVDAIRQYGAEPNADTHALWRRVVFNVLVSNTDDHLRNHGFLYEGGRGWRLSPAYDLNPVPVEVRPRVLSVSITLDDPTASLELAMEAVEYFGLSASEAGRISGEVGMAVSQWHQEATRAGIDRAEIDRMESAFEHEDLKQSLAMGRQSS